MSEECNNKEDVKVEQIYNHPQFDQEESELIPCEEWKVEIVFDYN